MSGPDDRSPPRDARTLTIQVRGPVSPVSRRPYLLVIDGNSATTFPLPPGGEIIIGRGRDAHLQLEDAAASRRHARLRWDAGDHVLEDLGSHNGTWVNGERLSAPRALVPNDVISVCDATLVFHGDAGGHRHRPIRDPAALRERLEEEVERSLRSGEPLALLCVHPGAGGITQADVAAALDGVLRLGDVAALGEGQLLLLLPGLSEEAAAAAAGRLLHSLGPRHPQARAGMACFARDGCDADTLLLGARDAAQAAPPGGVRDASAAVPTLTLGDRTIIVADGAMIRLFALLGRLAKSDLPVLVCGETGSGKEVAAAALHHGSRRSGHRLVALNCAALPESLAEGELFGYEKGAFSGAHAAKPGLIESAHQGTLFLDEVGELSPTLQAKLLRALETQKVMRLGEVQERSIDIRVVSATNRKLEDEVRAGRFRKDLLFRLSGARVMLPPLRDRRRELTLLARHFLAEACARAGQPELALSAFALQKLLGYDWPGNVRELRSAMEYVASTCLDPVAEPWHLPAHVCGEEEGPPQDTQAGGGELQRMRPLDEEVRELERTRIAAALVAAGGVQTRAAELLSMPLRTFTGKVKLYRLTAQANTRRRPDRPGER